MSAAGQILRSKIPGLYFAMIRAILYLRGLATPYMIYITDSLGGSFKEYFTTHPLDEAKARLLKGTDPESHQTVDTVVQRLLFYPDESQKKKISKKQAIAGGLLPVELPDMKRKIEREISQKAAAHQLEKNTAEASVFYFYHGLSLLPEAVQSWIKGQDFVDVGAYVGDSAIALHAFDYHKIFSIEMSRQSIRAYEENLRQAGIPPQKYEIINLAIGEKDGLPPIEIPDTGSAGFSLMRQRGQYDLLEVHQKSFDSIAAEYGIEPAFVKVDIEGYAMHFVIGGLRTLKKHRPVLSIAVYHNPTEFFEIKPLLEAELPNYIFMIRKLTPDVHLNHCHSEVILLAYPAELVDKEL
jgi:FkbM family methyltransferase